MFSPIKSEEFCGKIAHTSKKYQNLLYLVFFVVIYPQKIGRP